MTGLRCLPFVVATLLCLSLPSAATNTEYERESIRGVKSFGELVEDLGPTSTAVGLTPSQLQTSVELKLRLAGIKVATMEEAFHLPGYPYLYVQVLSAGKLTGVIGYKISLAFEQSVILERSPSAKPVMAATWSTTNVGTAGAAQVATEIKNDLGILMDEFLNAYLSVNPK